MSPKLILSTQSKYLKENLLFIEDELSSLLDSKRDYEDSLNNLYLPFRGFQNVIIEKGEIQEIGRIASAVLFK